MVLNTKKELYKSCIKIIYINSIGKNCFAFRTIQFSNSLVERIMFDNRGLTVPFCSFALFPQHINDAVPRKPN